MTALGAAGAIASALFPAARLGRALSSGGSQLAVFWPPILIALHPRALPVVGIGVVVGTVAADLMTNQTLATCLGNASVNAAEVVLSVAGFLAVASFPTAISALRAPRQ